MKALLLLAFSALALASQRGYHGFQVLRTGSLSMEQTQMLRHLEESSDMFDFWRSANPGMGADIMASPKNLAVLKDILAKHNIEFEIMMSDVQATIENSMKASTKQDDWSSYKNIDELISFYDGLAEANSAIMAKEVIGRTAEGRDISAYAITKAGANAPNVFLEAGIHAREWIAPAVTSYVVNELLSGAGSFIDNINFYIVPSANPDGYAFSWTSGNRLWRKNRADTDSGLGCKGIDLNRNWGFHWAESGSSSNPCTDTFHGTAAFSENESQAIRDYFLGIESATNNKTLLAICFHSYSQLILWPYGYAYNAYPENRPALQQLAEDAAAALEQVHGTVFDPINSADLYPAAGASDDWYMSWLDSYRYGQETKRGKAYTYELRDTGRYGFVLPEEQIRPSGEEAWAAVSVMLQDVVDNSKM